MGWLTGKKVTWDENQVIDNKKRELQMEKLRKETERKSLGLEYQNLLTKTTRDARTKAEGAVTSERAKGIKDASQLRTDFNSQERRRLFQAKKGSGQVGAEDTAITSEMVKGANTLLGRGADYWEAKRGAAGDKAYESSLMGFNKKYGTEQDYADSMTTQNEQNANQRSNDAEVDRIMRNNPGASREQVQQSLDAMNKRNKK